MNFRKAPDYFLAKPKKPLPNYTSPAVDYSRYESPAYIRRAKLVRTELPCLLRKQA